MLHVPMFLQEHPASEAASAFVYKPEPRTFLSGVLCSLWEDPVVVQGL